MWPKCFAVVTRIKLCRNQGRRCSPRRGAWGSWAQVAAALLEALDVGQELVSPCLWCGGGEEGVSALQQKPASPLGVVVLVAVLWASSFSLTKLILQNSSSLLSRDCRLLIAGSSYLLRRAVKLLLTRQVEEQFSVTRARSGNLYPVPFYPSIPVPWRNTSWL